MRSDKIIIEKDTLEKLYAEHGSLNKVAKALDVSAKTIKRRMKELGLEYEPKIEYTCDHNYFSTHGPAQAYWAGFLLADGYLVHRNYSYHVSCGLATKDKDHLEKFKAAVKFTGPLHDRIQSGIIFPGKTEPSEKDYENSLLTMTSKQMFDDLAKYNVVPRKTYICSFPAWLEDDQYCSHFIRGIIDGDGWDSIKYDTQAKIGIRGTKTLLLKIREVINKYVLDGGDYGYISNEKTPQLEFAGNKVMEKLIAYLYKDTDSNIWLTRKKKIIDKMMEDCKPYEGLNLQKEQLEQLYKKHTTIAGVAKELGHSEDVIKKYMAKYNLDWNKTTGWEQNHSYFSVENESPEQFYWAGYLLGNSTIDDNHIIVSSADQEKLEKFRAAGITGSSITGSKGMHRLSFTSEQIVKNLKDKFNITSEKKLKYSMPQSLIDHLYFKHFLRGKIETRASLSASIKSLELTGPLEYLQQLKVALIDKCQLNVDPKIGSRPNKNNHRLIFTGDVAKKVIEYIVREMT